MTEVRRILAERGGADLLMTDPPYNVDYHGKAGTISNDRMSDDGFRDFLAKAFRNASAMLRDGAAFYVWYADKRLRQFMDAIEEAGMKISENLIWVKNHFILGGSDYQWKHEPCLYGWKGSGKHYFKDSRSESTVLEDRPDPRRMTKEELIRYVEQLRDAGPASDVLRFDRPMASDLHPTMKPVRLIGYLVSNSTRKGETVLDPFGGSGSTLIACEQLGRKCVTVELDERYCDAIVTRWQDLTGRKAECIG